MGNCKHNFHVGTNIFVWGKTSKPPREDRSRLDYPPTEGTRQNLEVLGRRDRGKRRQLFYIIAHCIIYKESRNNSGGRLCNVLEELCFARGHKKCLTQQQWQPTDAVSAVERRRFWHDACMLYTAEENMQGRCWILQWWCGFQYLHL